MLKWYQNRKYFSLNWVVSVSQRVVIEPLVFETLLALPGLQPGSTESNSIDIMLRSLYLKYTAQWERFCPSLWSESNPPSQGAATVKFSLSHTKHFSFLSRHFSWRLKYNQELKKQKSLYLCSLCSYRLILLLTWNNYLNTSLSLFLYPYFQLNLLKFLSASIILLRDKWHPCCLSMTTFLYLFYLKSLWYFTTFFIYILI